MPEADPPVSQRFSGYEPLVPVAHGGMGTVWAARRKGVRGAAGLVGIKTMLPRFAEDPHFQRMFRVEAKIASRIGHRNVGAILALEEDPRQGLCLVMEWIEGSSLQTVLDACRERGVTTPYGVVARIGAQAARGLHAAHELRDAGGARLGLVHRDVSPHNILVSIDGTVKIIDFGIAKAVERVDNPTTYSGQIKGKMRYLSPEQAQGDDALDHRADIFTLGIVLYLLLTGAHPFEGNHDLATMRRIILAEPATAPLAAVPGCPAELGAAILKALAKEPRERFASMGDLAAALEAVAASSGVGDAELSAFVRERVGGRIAARAAKIEGAARARDEAVARSEAAVDPGARPDGQRRVLRAAALGALGMALGATILAGLALARPGGPAAAILESAGLAASPVAALVAPAQVAQRKPVPAPSAIPRAPAALSARQEARRRFREPGF